MKLHWGGFENKLNFLERYFVYGKPVESIEFFTEKEKEIMRKGLGPNK